MHVVEKKLGPWSQWGACSESCGSGVRVRTRDKLQTSLDDTDDTLTNQNEDTDDILTNQRKDTKECNTHGCPGEKLS